MNKRRLIIALFVLAITASAVLPAFAAPDSLTVTPSVQNQVCINGDTVAVTLTATAESSSNPVRFRWDFTNNGSWDTRAKQNPTVTSNYPDEVNVTAKVGARNPEGNLASNTVTFTTLRCTN